MTLCVYLLKNLMNKLLQRALLISRSSPLALRPRTIPRIRGMSWKLQLQVPLQVTILSKSLGVLKVKPTASVVQDMALDRGLRARAYMWSAWYHTINVIFD